MTMRVKTQRVAVLLQLGLTQRVSFAVYLVVLKISTSPSITVLGLGRQLHTV